MYRGMQPNLTIEFRIELIKRAIEHAEQADQRFREISADASRTPLDCDWARAHRDGAEAEFRWQWRNVKAVLAHYEEKEKQNAESV